MRTLHKALLLWTIGFLLYLPSFGNQFVWDDEQFIYKNHYVRTFDVEGIFTQSTTAGAGVRSDYYRPLTTLSFAIDHAVWGLNPLGFHLTNTLLHASAGVLLYLLLRSIGLADQKRHLLTPSWILALLFLIHPLQTEAVVYMNSRGDSLYTFFAFGSLLLLSLLPTKNIELKNEWLDFTIPEWGISLSTVILYIVAIFAKEIGIMTVALGTLLVAWKWWQHRHNTHSPWKQSFSQLGTLITMWITAGSYLLMRATILNFENSFNLYNEATVYTTNLHVRLLTFTNTLWTYWELLVVPHTLHMERNAPIITSFTEPAILAAGVVFLILAGIIIHELRTKRQPWLTLGVLWFFGGLAPVSGIVPINGLIYEHWLYVPMVGFFLALYGLWRLWPDQYKIQQAWVRPVAISFFVLYASALSIKTLHQNWLWRSPISLYTHLLNHTESARIQNNLGMAYADEGLPQQAIEHYQRSIELFEYPQTQYNLARTYVELGQYDQAIDSFTRAIELAPEFDAAIQQRILAAIAGGRLADAKHFTQLALNIYPDDSALNLFDLHLTTLIDDAEQVRAVTKAYQLKFAQNPHALQLLQAYQRGVLQLPTPSTDMLE